MLSMWYILVWYQYAAYVAATSSTTTAYTNNNSTCPSRTANYLTHTLPQQCLTSQRLATSPHTADATVGSITATDTDSITPQDTPSSHASNTPTAKTTVSQDDPISVPVTHATETQSAVTTVTATQIANQELVPALPDIIEEESPLESGNFLSFEEWKKQNLQKAGQSEHVGRDAKVESRDGRKRQSNLQNSLDSLGDDVEIDLDFSGFVPGGPEQPNAQTKPATEPVEGEDVNGKPIVVPSRKKDAGTTCKERYNYASFDCAASMLKTNPQAKSPGSILSENKDAYMLNQCSAENKFVILELCNDILVDTVVLANFEFFSSIFRTFRVSVSDRYPVKLDKWKILGTYEARNTREVQAFLVEHPLIWARYLRIEFLTHYGSEFYCPVSLVRVHGTTMLEEYKHDMDAVAGEDDEEAEATEIEKPSEETLVPEAVDQGILKERQEQEDAKSAQGGTTDDGASDEDKAVPTRHDECSVEDIAANYTLDACCIFPPMLDVCSIDEEPEHATEASAMTTMESSERPKTSSTTVPATSTTSTSSISVETSAATEKSSVHQTPIDTNKMANTTSVTPSTNSTQAERPVPETSQSSQNATHTERAKSSAPTSSEKSKQTSSMTQSAPASPTMQESFFKSVQKRLQMLESNSSLSLQYIEEQSRALRDAFRKVEQRQLSKTSLFLDHLNSTVLKELREFRQQYDNLWQSTVIELEMQREQYQRENLAMHARLGVLADELIFQKRMSILQMTLILVCLVLVLFSRGAINNYLELPLVQSVLSKSSGTKWMNLSGDSPSNPRKLTRARSAMQMGSSPSSILKGHRRLQSEDSNITDDLSQAEIYSPPTPVSFDGFSDVSQTIPDEGKPVSDPEFDAESIERPSTSPPTLSSTSEPTTPRLGGNHKFGSLESKMVSSAMNTRDFTPSPASSPAKHLKWDLPDPDS